MAERTCACYGECSRISIPVAQAPLHVAIKRRRKDLIQLLLQVRSGDTRGVRDVGRMIACLLVCAAVPLGSHHPALAPRATPVRASLCARQQPGLSLEGRLSRAEGALPIHLAASDASDGA